MIISRTPLRVSFAGGGTDYPLWYREHGGAVLAATIDKYCYVTLHDGQSWYTFDLPNKSGLGSSSAYTIGLLRACTSLDNRTIATLATTWEQDKTNGMVGSQDQYLCAMGGFHFLKFSEQGIRDMPIDVDISGLEPYLMLFNSHVYRRNGEVIPEQLKEMSDHVELYKRIGAMPERGVELLRQQDYKGFGALLDEGWQMKRQLSSRVSNPQIDEIYARAKQAGAIGGKLLGGGGGGFMLFVVELENHDTIKRELHELSYTPFRFEHEGTKVIYNDSRYS